MAYLTNDIGYVHIMRAHVVDYGFWGTTIFQFVDGKIIFAILMLSGSTFFTSYDERWIISIKGKWPVLYHEKPTNLISGDQNGSNKLVTVIDIQLTHLPRRRYNERLDFW